MLGNGDGTFQAVVFFAAGDSPGSVAVADLDGDTLLDLVATNGDSDEVSVLLGNGDGTFRAATAFAAGDDPGPVAVGDLDGDSVPDLVTAHVFSADVSVLLGNGDGSFQAPVSFAAGAYPVSVAVAELDGDSAPDLVTANAGGSASVLFNQRDPAVHPEIDIKPGSDPNSINPFSRGVVPVAIFGSEDFDVAGIDLTRLTFGIDDALPAIVGRRHRDVNADGFPDLLSHFRTAEIGIEIGDTEACLSGETLDGTPFSGCDTIRTVPDR
jgi:hypothetical protein